MEQNKLNYIEESALMFEQLGMTRMVGRVFGYLVVCDEDAVSFDQIRNTLQASKGSISATIKQLMQIGFIEAVSKPGDRKTYFRISGIELTDFLRARMKMFDLFSDKMNQGKKLRDRDDDVSQWLLEASAFYSWVGSQLEGVIDTWQKDKNRIIREYEVRNET